MAERPTMFRQMLTMLLRRREYGILLLLTVTVACVAMANPAFLAPANVRDILVQCAPVAIVAAGVMLVIVTAEIDISVGSMFGLLAAVLGILSSTTRLALPVWLAAAAVLALGALLGLLNAVLVAWGGVPSIIVTLGMLTALRGITEVVMGGEWVTNLPPALRQLGTGNALGVPLSLWAAALALLATGAIIHLLPVGRRIFALGSNAHSAQLAGLSARRLKLFVFTYTGVLVGVAVLFSVPQLSVIESGLGSGLELLVVTCVVVGGVSISGGQGTLTGVCLAVLLMMMIRTVLIFLKLGEMSTYWEDAIKGGFILLAVLLDHLSTHRHSVEAE